MEGGWSGLEEQIRVLELGEGVIEGAYWMNRRGKVDMKRKILGFGPSKTAVVMLTFLSTISVW